MQPLQYPMSAFNHVFGYFSKASHLRISAPDSTIVWLSQFSGDSQQHATTGFTPQEELIHKQDHRWLFFKLLRILMPNDASNLIDDAELAETQKNEFVDKHEFEDAARCLHQYDVAVAALSEYVNGDSTILPVHLQQLFDLLAAESAEQRHTTWFLRSGLRHTLHVWRRGLALV